MRIQEYEKIDDLKCIALIETAEELNVVLAYLKKSDELWYRGVSNAGFRLLPKGYRNLEVISNQFEEYVDNTKYRASISGDNYLLPDFEDMLDSFKEVTKEHIDSSIVKNEFDWLFVAQHYGLPTPLLDWTEDYNVALWFATKDIEDNTSPYDQYDEDYLEAEGVDNIDDLCIDIRRFEFDKTCAAIYILDPRDIEKIMVDFRSETSGPVDTDFNYEVIKSYIVGNKKPYGPMALRGKPIDVRLRNQKGNFTIHGCNIQELDYYTVLRKRLCKILIPHKFCKNIYNDIQNKGYTHEFIYNGFDPKEYATKAIEVCENKRYRSVISKYRESHNKSY